MQGLRKFFSGCYGMDALSNALMILSLLLLLIASWIGSGFWLYLPLLPFAVASIRFFSGRIPQRKRENQAFLNRWKPIEQKMVSFFVLLIDKGHYRYFVCPTCKRTLRMEKSKDFITITCPKCHTSFISPEE
ncbi:MAG TPA: hypothetical protein VFF80_04385 [Bacillota bacterium]|nr:hypothetical protein [Bacillota bacterium]